MKDTYTLDFLDVAQPLLERELERKLLENLKKFGYHVHQLDISQFLKAGGGIHCLAIATHNQLSN